MFFYVFKTNYNPVLSGPELLEYFSVLVEYFGQICAVLGLCLVFAGASACRLYHHAIQKISKKLDSTMKNYLSDSVKLMSKFKIYNAFIFKRNKIQITEVRSELI